MMASVARILPKNWFPNPSPWLAPFTSPAMSTISMVVGTIFEFSEGMKPLILDLNMRMNKAELTHIKENYKNLLLQIVRMYIYDMHDVEELLNSDFVKKLNTIKAFAEKSSYHPEADEKM